MDRSKISYKLWIPRASSSTKLFMYKYMAIIAEVQSDCWAARCIFLKSAQQNLLDLGRPAKHCPQTKKTDIK